MGAGASTESPVRHGTRPKAPADQLALGGTVLPAEGTDAALRRHMVTTIDLLERAKRESGVTSSRRTNEDIRGEQELDEVLDLLNGPSLQKFLERVEPAVVTNWDKIDPGPGASSRAGSPVGGAGKEDGGFGSPGAAGKEDGARAAERADMVQDLGFRSAANAMPSRSLPAPSTPGSPKSSTMKSFSVENFSCFIPKIVAREIMRSASVVRKLSRRRDSFSGQTATAAQFEAAVLFADMSGFTALTERLAARPNGAELLCEALTSFFTVLLEQVEIYGGDCVKFAGDALCILWPVDTGDDATTGAQQAAAPGASDAAGGGGAAAAADGGAEGGGGGGGGTRTVGGGPRTLEEATLHAARCSAAVHERLRGYPQVYGVTLTMHMGLGAGTVTTLYVGGTYSRWEFVVAGDPMNQIAVAEPLAQKGQTVLSPQAFAHMKKYMKGEMLQAPHDDYAAQTAFYQTEAEAAWEIMRAKKPQLQRAMVNLTKSFIPNAIFQQLYNGYASYLAEMRELSILFINVQGLVVEGPGDLERTHNMMRAVQTATYQFEGSINKLLVDDKGTLMLVAFGLPPLAHTDDPVRAVAAAFSMRRGLNKLGLRVSIGITTGEIFCGVIGSSLRREYTVMGDSVNLSARLMGMAKADEIICDEFTARRCVENVLFETLPPVFVKGKVRAVHPFRPTKWIAAGAKAAKGKKLLIGRLKEKAKLEKMLETLKVEKGGTLVLLGEQGVGKTAFLHLALRETAAAKGFGVLGSHSGTSQFLNVMPGRKAASTDWSATLKAIDILDSFKAWEAVIIQALTPTDALRRNSFFNYGESAMTCRDSLVAILPQALRPHVSLLQKLLPGLRLDDPDTQEANGDLPTAKIASLVQQMLAAVLSAASAERPVLCLLDSCHTLDDASWALLDTLETLRKSPDYRGQGISVCVVTRPAHHTSFKYTQYAANVKRAQQSETFLELGPLTGDDYRKYLHQTLALAGGSEVPQQLVDYIFEKSQGNPFFVGELLQNLMAEGAVYVLDEQCFMAEGPARRLNRFQIPRTLTRVTKAFIDRLSPHEQMVVKVASVLPRPFELHALAQAFKDDGLIDDRCDDQKFLRERQGQALERLVSEGVFFKDMTEREAEPGEEEIEGMVRWRYQFVSPVMVEVASKLLLSQQTKQIKQSERRATHLRRQASRQTMTDAQRGAQLSTQQE